MKDRYFKIYSSESFVFYIQECEWMKTGYLEYSFDCITWKELGTQKINVNTAVNGMYEIYLRGKGNTTIPGNKLRCTRKSKSRMKISVSGDIETLLDYAEVENGNVPAKGERCFESIFENWDYLVDASALVINHVDAPYSCSRLFRYCRFLENAPDLPATELEQGCYNMMFEGCNTLKEAPELEAEEIKEECYTKMFKDCVNLEKAPSYLPSVIIPRAAYKEMFSGCASLKIPTDILGDNAKQSACEEMFMDCISLESAPYMDVVYVEESCLKKMFYNCTKLKSAPVLVADQLAPSCYEEMFSGCTSLKKKPKVNAAVKERAEGMNMFEGCHFVSDEPILKRRESVLPKIRITDIPQNKY